MSSNDYPDDATPEEIARWRAEDRLAEQEAAEASAPPDPDSINGWQVREQVAPVAELLPMYLLHDPEGRTLLGEVVAALPVEQQAYWAEFRKQKRFMEARDHAKRMLQAASSSEMDLPALTHLSDFLDEPDEEVAYRVDRLWPRAGRVVFAAQQKAGKTTVTGNLARSLADGEPFLDEFFVAQAGRIVLVDNELAPQMWRRWLRDQGIGKVDSVDLLSLRGRLSSFNILDASVRSKWAKVLGSADVLIFDCLRPALDALGLSEDKDAGRFLEAMDELIAEAGIGELLIVHHMGHSNERSRGDSRILDWPDAVWSLVREDDDPTSPRYFRAYGRDVDQPEVLLAYDPDTRHLGIGGGSRRAERTGRFAEDVLAYVADNEGCSQSAIEEGVAGDRTVIRDTIKKLARDGLLTIRKGPRNANLHYMEEASDE